MVRDVQLPSYVGFLNILFTLGSRVTDLDGVCSVDCTLHDHDHCLVAHMTVISGVS